MTKLITILVTYRYMREISVFSKVVKLEIAAALFTQDKTFIRKTITYLVE